MTFLGSGILNFDGTTTSKTISVNGLTNDIEVLLIPLYWQYINNIDPSKIYSMNLNYSKNNNDTLDIHFYTTELGTGTPSSSTI